MTGDISNSTTPDSKRQKLLKGLDALFFASSGKNYTWVPLLEKAYAKVHGDYEALHGGPMAEAFEDLTRGIGQVILTGDIKSQEQIWQDLLHMDEEHVYALDSPSEQGLTGTDGIALHHAYAAEKACTLYLDGWKIKPVKLLKIRYGPLTLDPLVHDTDFVLVIPGA